MTGVILAMLPLPVVLRATTDCDGFNIAARGQGLLLGALLTLILKYWDEHQVAESARVRRLLAIALACVPGPYLVRIAFGSEGGLALAKLPMEALFFDVVFACGVGVIVLRSGRPWLRPLRNPVLCRIGLISYGIYMCHYGMFSVVERFAPRGMPGSAMALIQLAAAYLAAEVSWRFLEQPFLTLKDRFTYRD